jgi:hypothetical protein
MSNSKLMHKMVNPCKICGGEDFLRVDFNSYTQKLDSSNPSINSFQNQICDRCGVVSPFPFPLLSKLKSYYNSSYRNNDVVLNYNGSKIELPVQFNTSEISFKRAQSFFDAVSRLKSKFTDIEPNNDDTIIDYGAYQGIFLSALVTQWGCEGIAYDFNQTGIEFAKNAFGLQKSVVTKNIYEDVFEKKARFVTSIHNFEHLDNPIGFLTHLRQNILAENGWLYIEVPNLYGFSLSDPTHFFNFNLSSLTYTLEVGGFSVRDIWVSGFPEYSNMMWNSGHQNLHCLAQIAEIPKKREVMRGTALSVYQNLRYSCRRNSIKFLGRQYLFVFRTILQTLVHTLGVALTDLMPLRLQKIINFDALLNTALNMKNALLKNKK